MGQRSIPTYVLKCTAWGIYPLNDMKSGMGLALWDPIYVQSVRSRESVDLKALFMGMGKVVPDSRFLVGY